MERRDSILFYAPLKRPTVAPLFSGAYFFRGYALATLIDTSPGRPASISRVFGLSLFRLRFDRVRKQSFPFSLSLVST